MAVQPDTPTFSIDDKTLLRLTCIHKKVATDVLRFAFEKDTKDRPQYMPLLEYYKSKGISGFKRRLNKEQKNRIDANPDGATFDITLLYYCLRNGSCCLAPEDDVKWTSKNGNNIESLLGIVKDKRNNLAHEHHSFTKKQLLDEVQELKSLLIEIIRWCGKHYGLSSTVTDLKIDEIERNVRKYLYDDFEPTTFEEYKNELFFEAQCEYVISEGVKDLQEQYDKQCEDRVSTVNHLVDINLPLENIYTEMKLKGESASGLEQSITFEEVLLDSGQNRTSDIVVISGVAGVGKTTFTKKMLCDWRSERSKMKHLTYHNILLKTECRNKVIKHFDDLLYTLMPRVSRNFKVSDLSKVILYQNVLLIVDGLDELNKNSADLFEEILELKKSRRISLLITTRPEKLTYLKKKINSHQLAMKHIELVGVPVEKRAELVTKYHNAIAKNHMGIQDIGGLLTYLEKTKFQLADLWKLPYNLTLITLLWAYDHMSVTAINTAPELYKEILELCKTKLIERLGSYEKTHHLPMSELRINVDIFLRHLAKESLTGLKDNHINLPQEAYERLEKVSRYINIPVQELTSAFLQRLPGAKDLYSFPHKGLQDYLAALYILMEITKTGETIDIQKAEDNVAAALNQSDIEFDKAQNILRLTKDELKGQSPGVGCFSRARDFFPIHYNTSSVISNVMQEIHKPEKYDVSKFQNMFMYLIGLFYSENDTVHKKIKLEALKLLQKSGIQNKEHWITVLNSVKCEDYVASFISKQPSILDGYTKITDSSVSAYVSLMEALRPPMKNGRRVKVDIDIAIKGELNDSACKLFELINSHQFRVRSILVNDNNFKTYMAMLEALKIPFVDAGRVNAEIVVDEDLHSIIELLRLIKENGIAISVLKVRDIDINDLNLSSIISTMKSLPYISKNGNITGMNLDIEGNSFNVDELRELIVNYQFKIKRFLVNENNYEKYTQMFESITVPLKDTHGLAMEIMIDRDIIDLADILKEIKGKNFRVKKFKVRDLCLTDRNVEKYYDALKIMSPQWRKANTTVVDIQIYDQVKYLETIMILLAELEFEVKNISIRDENIGDYTRVLKNQKTPLKDAQKVVVDIDVTSDLLGIKELLRELKDKNFQILLLKLKSNKLRIDDNNANEYAEALTELQFKEKVIIITDENVKHYTAVLKSLNTPLKDAHDVIVDINVTLDLLGIKELLKAIKDRNFKIRNLEFRSNRVWLNDSNAQEYAEAFELLPTSLSGAYNDTVVLDISRKFSVIRVIMTLLAELQFKGKIIFIRDENVKHYTEVFKNLERPFKDAQDLMRVVCLDVTLDLLDIKELLREIKDKNFEIRNLKLKSDKFRINDSNVHEYAEALELLPKSLSGTYNATVVLDICRESSVLGLIMTLIAELKFKVKVIFIKDQNVQHYTALFKSLKTPLKDAQDVIVFVDVTLDILEIKDLLEEIKNKNFLIKNLEFKSKTIWLNDYNAHEYTKALKLLPISLRGTYRGNVVLDISMESSVIGVIMILLAELQFQVKMIFIRDENVRHYATVLKSLTIPLKDAQDVIVDMKVTSDLLDTYTLLMEMKNFQIRNFELKSNAIWITDRNAHEYAKALKLLPTSVNNNYKTTFMLDFQGNSSVTIGIIMMLLVELQFKVKVIIRDKNVEDYTKVFNKLKSRFRDGQELVVYINVTLDLLMIKELLWEIKEKKLQIGNLNLMSNTVCINDSNAQEYADTLELLPISLRGSFKATAVLDISRESSVIEKIRKMLVELEFKMDLISGTTLQS